MGMTRRRREGESDTIAQTRTPPLCVKKLKTTAMEEEAMVVVGLEMTLPRLDVGARREAVRPLRGGGGVGAR